jgi:hypothetical protein
LGCDSCPYSIILNLISEKKRQLSNVQGGRGLNTREPRKFARRGKPMPRKKTDNISWLRSQEKHLKRELTKH